MRLVVVLVLIGPLAGCGGSGEPTTWETAGRVVDSSVIESYRGEGHCGWDKVSFLNVGTPLGAPSDGTGHQYVRDPNGVLADQTRAEYQGSASLPDAAEDTGYSSDIGELWLVPDDRDPDVAYIVSDDRVEVWPRTRQVLGCD